jgi:hypothetical protein
LKGLERENMGVQPGTMTTFQVSKGSKERLSKILKRHQKTIGERPRLYLEDMLIVLMDEHEAKEHTDD